MHRITRLRISCGVNWTNYWQSNGFSFRFWRTCPFLSAQYISTESFNYFDSAWICIFLSWFCANLLKYFFRIECMVLSVRSTWSLSCAFFRKVPCFDITICFSTLLSSLAALSYSFETYLTSDSRFSLISSICIWFCTLVSNCFFSHFLWR